MDILLNAPVEGRAAIFPAPAEEVDRVRSLPATGPNLRLHLDGRAERGLQAHIVLEPRSLQRGTRQLVGFRRVPNALSSWWPASAARPSHDSASSASDVMP